ncbi:MAG: ABC transporter ATP-binding protein [Gammaproteobacteria bacterium]|nr:ABC transporter ATP-binding protein [Gammaproteobacteria bacterium]
MSDFTIKNLNLSSISENFSHTFHFSIKAGECLGITGPSGIGKSVLLKALADMLPHQGQLILGDIEAHTLSAPQWRKKVTLLPAESQWWCDTVGEHFHRFDDTLFAQLGFTKEVMNWQINHLSSGEKQRLACIRLLMNEPEVLLLDEPTANLDKTNQEKLEHIITEYQHKHSAPIIWISHDNEQLERVCQHLLILNKDEYKVISLKKAAL